MKKKIFKVIAVFLAINIFFDAVYPTAALALTGGPKQPEMQGFTPVATSEMVNAFTGDFNYNIPLLDVGGYPINLSYQSGITTDQEASWVGLGWSLNPGVISRSMRSLPDDFNGDEVTKEFNIKPNLTYGVKFFPSLELVGVSTPKNLGLSYGLGLTYNNYNGYSFSASLDLKISSNESAKLPGTIGLGLTAGSEQGLGISPSLSFSRNIQVKQFNEGITPTLALAYNTRAGLQQLSLFNGSRGVLSGLKTSVSFASPTYMPSSGHSMINTNLSLDFTLGTEILPAHLNGRVQGFYAGQHLLHKTETFPAYGYINSENATADKVLLDFNREKEGAFNENTPTLPLSNFTYDVYNVSGQGIGGMYRPHRSDIGVLYDSKVIAMAAGANIGGIEIGTANLAHLGLNVSVNQSNSKSGKWKNNNEVASVLEFKGTTDDPLYEPAYFKQSGEKNAESDESFFKDMGGFDPVRINFNQNVESTPTERYYNQQGTNLNTATRSKRARRNEVVSTLNAIEAKNYGDIKLIENYGENAFMVKTPDQYKNIFQPDTISRDDGERKDHHISQITTYRSDGAKYVYGIPAYNFKQDERTFAVQDEDYADPSNDKIVKGLVQYAAGDDSKENAKGLDHYFERTVMPAYAHSYLLTEILSADYVDVTGDGPTDDDLGTYTKINYTRTTGDYKWRVPYTNANFNEGLKSVKGDGYGDNKGSYVYGEKELWYIHSIETKNYVAKFYIENRADGYGVQNEQGGFSTDSKTKKLRKIELYSKQELLNSTAQSRPALPLKTVHFEYEYSLCKNIDNNILKYNSGAITDENGFPNQGGKLTLKKVYFTYANSLKGQLSPYQFSYDSYNPDYNLKAYDRWGNYKENTGAHPTSEFPYTDQSADSQGVFAADRDASAWHMTGIQLPSGGKINVNYEADDYAYVQNKRAMQMFKVVAVTGSEPGSLPSSDFNKLYNDGTPNSRNYLIFELPNASANISDVGKELFREKDGSEMDTLYFRFKVDLGGALNTEHVWEYVSGYAGIDTDVSETDRYGMFTNGTQKYGWVKLNSIRIKDKIDRSPDVNPISQAAWCFTKMHLPLIAYGQKRLEDGAVLQIVKSIANTLKQLITLPNGFYNQMRIDKKSQVFDVANSFIRLYNPVDKKKGGGCRVKQLTLSDKWHDMTNSNGNSLYTDAEYGQQYDYTIKDAYGNSISSGVASYEPILGGDENPFRKPVPYEILHKWAASDEFYQEEPFGESFFPGASVGYSKVTIKNLQHTNVTHHATGAVVNEFYTAKDFPTITSRTTTDVKRVKSNPLLKLLKIRARDFMTATQGFVIELNDMHGKPKGTYVYAEGKDKPISGVKYIYKTTVKQLTMPEYVDQPIQVGSLDNNMLVMERDGSIKTKMTGVDYDFVTDMHEDETVNRSTGANGNMESFFAGVFPAVICTVLLSFGQERTRFRTAVTTKVINRYGILEETVAYDQGSIVSTKNKMLDAETGEVLLTETKNQFNDPIYSFNYPAHIEYDRMGPAYRNIGVTADANVSNPSRYFVPGDEVEVLTIATGVYGPKAWIKNVGPSLLQAIDKDGMSVDLTGKRLRVIRSGRRNQQSVSIGTIVSKKSPLNDTNGDGIPDELNVNSATAILNADAKEFSEEWGLFCKCGIQEGQPYNPYTKGTRGNWRPFKSYVQLTGRTQDKLNGNTNVREDGIYTSYIPFWKPPVVKNTTDPWQKSVENWQMVSEVSIYSPYGMELENKDALGIYSSAVYGYNNSLPLVVAANAKYKEIAFDSFEDYDFTSCKDDHFSYKTVTPTNDKLMRTKSHTGKTSIKVAPNSELQISKTLISCPEPQ